MPASPSTLFALALDGMPGVGRVTAGRLLAHFPTYDALLAYPREQVLTRLKGAPNAEALVARLFDRSAMAALLAEAAASLQRLGAKHVDVLAPGTDGWPSGVAGLPRATRPFLLYAYGDAGVLQAPSAALFARPPISGPAFEQAQALVRQLVHAGIAPATGAAGGFDIVVHKLATDATPPQPSLLVAACGLARLAPNLRPVASQVVRQQGLLLSPFAMTHGPYEHDDRDRALLQAALAGASVFVEPEPETPEWLAMEWALEAGRPVFGVASRETPPLPARVHRLQTATDFDWVVAAVRRLP